MSDTYNYPAEIERDEDGRHVVTFPDFGVGGNGRRHPGRGAVRSQGLAA